ncbi:CpaF family protein [Desulfitibacter alkalitolerans]|uniref:CpaF family protein n=1 Tax=Desulfitibacter alkalitolerans TaxID=264641 RepID=UPI000481ED37|nr:CpaF family protein [Desulfitibacter alkalitolerans]
MSLMQRLENSPTATKRKDFGSIINTGPSEREAYQELKRELHLKIIKEFGKVETDKEKTDKDIQEKISELIDEQKVYLPRAEKQQLIKDMLDEINGLGPITKLMEDETITEIMVNGPDNVYIERRGKLELTNVRFRDNDHVMHIIEKIVSPIGRRIDESMPMVDARLSDGSRVNCIIPPLALTGPTITIRKFSKEPFTIVDLIRFGTLTPEMAKFIEACVRARLNIIVSGGTGSGKTTLLNCLSSFIGKDERIVTIEDAAELQLSQPHVISLETRPPNIEGTGAITIRDLVRNSLRMRPNRVVVGEVRSGEALDMLQAMNTGHDGSLTTAHANTPRDMLARLETMVLMAGMDLPIRAIREQIVSAVDLIIQQSRMKDGSRKITHITEVLGLEGDIPVLQDIFIYKQDGMMREGKVMGQHKATGIRPKFADKLKGTGVNLSESIFEPFSGFRDGVEL